MSDKITHAEYDKLENRINDLYSALEDEIDNYEPSDPSELDLRSFDQGKVAAYRSMLPFTMFDRPTFRFIELSIIDIENILKEIKENRDANSN